jgi:hypothetical protein
MYKKINILKGRCGGIKISNSTFPLLKDVSEDKGVVTAQVDASSVLGNEFKNVLIEVEDYRLL